MWKGDQLEEYDATMNRLGDGRLDIRSSYRFQFTNSRCRNTVFMENVHIHVATMSHWLMHRRSKLNFASRVAVDNTRPGLDVGSIFHGLTA